MEWLLENFEWMVLVAGVAVIAGVFVRRHFQLKKQGRYRQ
jgi:hypothetical protein